MGGTGNLPVPVGNLPTGMTAAGLSPARSRMENRPQPSSPRLVAGRDGQVARATHLQILICARKRLASRQFVLGYSPHGTRASVGLCCRDEKMSASLRTLAFCGNAPGELTSEKSGSARNP